MNVLITLLLSGCDYRNNYRKGLESIQARQGKIATIKQRSGHVKEYIVVGDSGYFQEAEDCPMCAQELRNKKRQDSIRQAEERKARLLEQLNRANEEGNERGIIEDESDPADSVHH